ncbi:substrate-binding domain-containing protein [Acidiferrimicrobium sp. IK]|uniref:substrate-binding domain-containing protein n=1 Tax=Acidiferrimicrobium sp. IK TaxID=2871700 RepID=UPI0021CB6FBE|nr:substrate-binding domain-containing protein [Acidiferrimicrobium sp. IK]MCU4186428.1 substrate-binding domain-containing protein [Acidiferrimicrobium sp. IK]
MGQHPLNGTRRRSRRALAASTFLAVGLIASACGSSSASKGSAAAGSTAAGSTSAGAAAAPASAQLSAAESVVKTATDVHHGTFPMPSTPVKPGQWKVFLISPNQADPYSGFAINNFEDAAKVMGWQLSPVHDAAGSAATAAGFIEQAIQQGYNALFYPSMQVQALSTPIKNALAAHLVIACPDCLAYPEYGPNFITPDVDQAAAGRALGAYAMTRSGGSGTFLAYPDPQYSFIEARYQAFLQYLQQNCSACKVKTSEYTTAYLTQQGPPIWTSALSANPSGTVKAAVAPFPFAAQQMVQTEHNEGRSDIPLMDFGAAEGPTQQLMASGTVPYVATITVPEVYEDWVSADLIARALGGQPLYSVTNLPSVLTTPDNVKSMLDGSSSPSFDFKAQLQKSWGK